MRSIKVILAALLLVVFSGISTSQIYYQDIVPDHLQNTWGFKSVRIDSSATATLTMGGAGVLNIWSEFGTRTALKAFSDCEVLLAANSHPAALFLNAPINSTGTWVLPNYALLFNGTVGNWSGAVDQYLGVRVKNGNDWLYGWIRLDVNTAGNSVTIKDYACNLSPNAPILAGQTTAAAPTYSNITISSCDSYNSPSGNYIWTTSNTYYDTILNTAGGDSIMTINLTILNSSSDSLSIVTCGPYTAPSGNLLSISGFYTDTIVNSVGCDSLIYINLDIKDIDTNVSSNGITLTSNATGGVSYQWIDCGNNMLVSGANSAQFSPTANGSYAVVISDGPCSDTSNCHTITGISTNDLFKDNEVLIYPNPATDQLSLEFVNNQNYCTVNLYDIHGKMILSKKYSNLSSLTIPLTSIKPGTYLLNIQIEGEKLIGEILIIHP